MKFIAMVLTFVLMTAAYWVPVAAGVVAVVNGHLFGLVLIALGLWLAFRA